MKILKRFAPYLTGFFIPAHTLAALLILMKLGGIDIHTGIILGVIVAVYAFVNWLTFAER